MKRSTTMRTNIRHYGFVTRPMDGPEKSKLTSRFTIYTSRTLWKRVPGHKCQWSLLQCKQTQLQMISKASMLDTHKRSIMVKTTTTTTWTGEKQWRRRRQTLLITAGNTARH
eukprot:5067975-Amphidinium_carterae.1